MSSSNISPEKQLSLIAPQPCITPFQTCHLFISVFFWIYPKLVELGPCMFGLSGLITLEQYSFWDRCIDIYDNCKIMWECKIFTFAPSSQFRQLGPSFFGRLWPLVWFLVRSSALTSLNQGSLFSLSDREHASPTLPFSFNQQQSKNKQQSCKLSNLLLNKRRGQILEFFQEGCYSIFVCCPETAKKPTLFW